jgi:hypothetical protein
MEGQHYLRDATENGTFVKFSEEELVQCATSTGNHGCQGGLMNWAFAWVEQHGITTEENYPYTSGKGVTGTCAVNKEQPVAGKFVSF